MLVISISVQIVCYESEVMNLGRKSINSRHGFTFYCYIKAQRKAEEAHERCGRMLPLHSSLSQQLCEFVKEVIVNYTEFSPGLFSCVIATKLMLNLQKKRT